LYIKLFLYDRCSAAICIGLFLTFGRQSDAGVLDSLLRQVGFFFETLVLVNGNSGDGSSFDILANERALWRSKEGFIGLHSPFFFNIEFFVIDNFADFEERLSYIYIETSTRLEVD
jgi:hypothetical protein